LFILYFMILDSLSAFYSDIDTLYYCMGALVAFELTFQRNWRAVLWIGAIVATLAASTLPLKNFFQVTSIYNPKHYGFPSGHLYWFTALYGWVCFRISQLLDQSSLPIKTILKIFVNLQYMIMMGLIGYYTVTHGYHTWYDIAGGIAFGSFLLMICILIIKNNPNSISPGCRFCQF
jgi:membrane-associated phospholipid phosphatase